MIIDERTKGQGPWTLQSIFLSINDPVHNPVGCASMILLIEKMRTQIMFLPDTLCIDSTDV